MENHSQDTKNKNCKENIVTPWDVKGEVDYLKLTRDFGCSLITDEILSRFERITNKPLHPFLKRNIFYSHRDLNRILDAYESKKLFYLYTGRGPSSDVMHMGHLVPFLFTKYLQDVFNVPLVIQITDDEKFLFKDISHEEMEVYARENIRDIIAIGFDVNKTFIFQNYNYMGHMYRLVTKIQKHLTSSQVKGCFGLKGEDNIGKWNFCTIQMAPCFPECFPHFFPECKPSLKPNISVKTNKGINKNTGTGVNSPLCFIPAAIDQDPYFRLTRDIAGRLFAEKPASIYSKFFPALTGNNTKMSGSALNSGIFLNDTPQMVKTKVNRAFTGSGATKQEQLLLGSSICNDIPLQWLFFLMEDDNELKDLVDNYAKGRLMAGHIKNRLITILNDIIKEHQNSKVLVTDETIDKYMSMRPII